MGDLFGVPIVMAPSFAMVIVFTLITWWAEPKIRRLDSKRRRSPFFLLQFGDLERVERAISDSESNFERRELRRLQTLIRIAFACWLLIVPSGIALHVVQSILF